MAITIFEDKRVEKNDTVDRMRFPGDANLRVLPKPCNNPGDSGRLPVKDEEGTQWTLSYKNQNGKIYFTDGWRVFRERKGIQDGHKISLYKEDDAFGSGTDQYKITVVRKRENE